MTMTKSFPYNRIKCTQSHFNAAPFGKISDHLLIVRQRVEEQCYHNVSRFPFHLQVKFQPFAHEHPMPANHTLGISAVT